MTKKLLTIALYMATTLLLVWLAVSYFDIVSNNLTTCKYWDYNLFIILGGLKA